MGNQIILSLFLCVLNEFHLRFVMFKNYRIPRDNLLNKVGDVNENGEYITQIKDPNKRHGASLGSLSVGRVNITVMVEAMGVKAITIALRYAAVRKQFGPNENTEIPLIEYQSHVNLHKNKQNFIFLTF